MNGRPVQIFEMSLGEGNLCHFSRRNSGPFLPLNASQPTRGELQVRLDADAPARGGGGLSRRDHRGGEAETGEGRLLHKVVKRSQSLI